MTTDIVNSDTSLQTCIGNIREDYRIHKYLKVSRKTGKNRSLPQNAISHAWYEQLARELREHDTLGWKRECKLTIGVPILRAEEPEFREKYDRTLRHLNYEQKIEVMDWLPVTSIMTKEQLSKYLEAMQVKFATRVRLDFPEVAQ